MRSSLESPKAVSESTKRDELQRTFRFLSANSPILPSLKLTVRPENRPLEKEIPIGNHHLNGAMLVFQGGYQIAITKKRVPSFCLQMGLHGESTESNIHSGRARHGNGLVNLQPSLPMFF